MALWNFDDSFIDDPTETDPNALIEADDIKQALRALDAIAKGTVFVKASSGSEGSYSCVSFSGTDQDPEPPSTLTDLFSFTFRANHSNTGPSTLTVGSSEGSVEIVRPDGSSLEASDIAAGQIVSVRWSAASGKWIWENYFPPGAHKSAFTDLEDAPPSYSGMEAKVVAVNTAGTGLEFIDPPTSGTSSFLGLSDSPESYSGMATKFVSVSTAETGLVFVDAPAVGVAAFTDLTDVPSSYSGMEAKVVAVNTAGTGLEFIAPGEATLPQPLGTSDSPGFSSVSVSSVRLSTAGTEPSYAEGNLYWSADDKTLTFQVGVDDVALQVGQEQVIQVRNSTASTITNGSVVMYDGTIGSSGRIKAVPMVADGTVPGMKLLGVATHDIEAGSDGMVTVFGKVRGIDTSGMVEGGILWANPATPGGLTATQPAAPNLKLPIAVVINSAVNGTIFVRATPGTSLVNDDQVEIVSPADGDVLAYNETSGRWENAAAAAAALPQPLDTTDTPQFARIGIGESADSSIPITGKRTTPGVVARFHATDTDGLYIQAQNASPGWGTLSNGAYVNSSGDYIAVNSSGSLVVQSPTGGIRFYAFSGLTPGQTITTTNYLRMSIPITGSVVIGQAAVATNATDGFPYIPSCPGTPTATPTANTGMVPVVYDSTNSVLYAYNGSWKRVDAMPINTKGDLLVHTGSARARLPVGTDGQVLTADSNQTNGVKWASPAASSGWSADNLTVLTRNAMQSLLSWQEPYDASRTNVIEWDVETHDGLGVWSAEAPKLITIAASGWYSIAAHLPVVMNSWSRACVLLNQDNFGSGTGYLESIIECIPTGSSADPKVHRVIIPAVHLSAGDVLRVVVVGYAAGNTGTGAEHCKLWLQRLA